MEDQSDMQGLSQWFTKRWKRLKHQIALIQTNTKPVIDSFYTDELFVTEQGKVNLYWKVEHAHYISINQKVGDVTEKEKIIVRLAPNVRSFTLTAYGGLQKVSCTIELEPARFRDDKMPLASGFKIPQLQAKRSESTKKGRSFQQANEFEVPKLVVNLPLKPQARELNELRETLQEAFKVKEIAVLEARLRELKQTDLLDKLSDIDYDETAINKEVKP